MMTMLMMTKLINTWVKKTRIESCCDEAFLDNASMGNLKPRMTEGDVSFWVDIDIAIAYQVTCQVA